MRLAPGGEPQRREKYVDPDILLRLRGLRDWGEVAFCHSADREPLLFFADQFGVRVLGAIMPRFSEPVPPTPRWERLP